MGPNEKQKIEIEKLHRDPLPPLNQAVTADYSDFLGTALIRTPSSSREAGSLINRPLTFRTIRRFWHPRTGLPAFLLLLSATTELLVLNLIPQHDP
jgi:hypothetical protein